MNCECGQLPMHHAIKLITANSVLPERGGIFIIKRFVLPITTFSSAVHIASWCGARIIVKPFRALNIYSVKAKRSLRYVAISLGVILTR